jgi:hypothetical protein
LSCTIVPNFTKIAKGIYVKELADYLQKYPELWEEITARQSFPDSPHIDTKSIYFRGPEFFSLDEYQGNTEAESYEVPTELSDILLRIFNTISPIIPCTEVGYGIIVNLLAGGEVFEHTDEGAYAEYYTRYHIVVQSNEGNVFTVNGEDQIMQEGELWSFNHRAPHSVINLSTEDRIHIIFDVK